MINKDDIARIFVHADRADIGELGPELIATMERNGIDSPLRACHFLAQVGHESGELRYRAELASGQAYEGRRDLGNTEDGDGRRFKGRGLIQLTGRANYTAYDRERGLHGQLLINPEMIAQNPELCCDVAGWYWSRRGLNIWADRDDVKGVTLRVNGGYNGLRDRRRLLILAKRTLIEHDDPPGSRVFDLQERLTAAGFAVMIDGQSGPETRAAVARFQKSRGLVVDGIAGPNTWAALRRVAVDAG